jgi:hypothetical protein
MVWTNELEARRGKTEGGVTVIFDWRFLIFDLSKKTGHELQRRAFPQTEVRHRTIHVFWPR